MFIKHKGATGAHAGSVSRRHWRAIAVRIAPVVAVSLGVSACYAHAGTPDAARADPSKPVRVTAIKPPSPLGIFPAMYRSLTGGTKAAHAAPAAMPVAPPAVAKSGPVRLVTSAAPAAAAKPARPPGSIAAASPRSAAPSVHHAPAVQTAATATGPAPPVACPPGTLGMWSRDVTAMPVYICHFLHPQP